MTRMITSSSSPIPNSFPKGKIKVLLLEGIHSGEISHDENERPLALTPSSKVAAERFRSDGFAVEELKGALTKEELIKKLPGVYILGIRCAAHSFALVSSFNKAVNDVKERNGDHSGRVAACNASVGHWMLLYRNKSSA